MKNLNIPKLSTSSVVCISLTISLFFMAVWIYQSSAAFVIKAQKAKDENIGLSTAAQQMRVDVIQIQQWLTDISATRARDGLDDGFVEAENSYQSLMTGLGIFEQFYSDKDSEMLAQVWALRDKADAYYLTGQKMAHAYIDEGPAGGNQMMAQFDDAAAALYDQLDPFVNDQVSSLTVAMGEIVSSANTLKSLTVIVFSIVFLVTFAGLYLQSRNNHRQIDKILKTMRDSADGDLTVMMAENSGQMSGVSSAINGLIGKFAQVILKVKENADFVFDSAEQISDGNHELSRRLQEQASSLEETASSMEQMTSTVKQNADSASEANKLTTSAREEAEKGGRIVEKAVSAMRDINNSSNSIADIIGTIESIAFQTNLLALNAAVEAARAGEEGRGFAVVATEVRNLAQRSAVAAKEIKTLIDESVEKVKIGTEQVDKSGETLLGIINGIKRVDELVAEINNASREQAMGIDGVNIAVAQIDERIQQNAVFVGESSESSRRMKDQVTTLNDVVGFFKLGDLVKADGHRQLVQLQMD